MAQNSKNQQNRKSQKKGTQLTFTHLIVTALAMLVIGYLFGRFSVQAPVTGNPPSGETTAAAAGSPGTSTDANITALQKAANDSPESAAAWTDLGNAYFDASRFSEAIEAYTRSLELDPNNPDVITDRGVMYRRIGEPVKAIQDFDEAAALDPEHPMSRFNKGIVLYYDLNDATNARRAFQEVLDMDPDFVTPSGAYLRDFMGTLR
jgi:tetratricopeptide (TPR) repeat protein